MLIKSQIKKMSFQPILKYYLILCGPQVMVKMVTLFLFAVAMVTHMVIFLVPFCRPRLWTIKKKKKRFKTEKKQLFSQKQVNS